MRTSFCYFNIVSKVWLETDRKKNILRKKGSSPHEKFLWMLDKQILWLKTLFTNTSYNVCLSTRGNPRFPVNWRLLVKERIANVGIPPDLVLPFWWFFGVITFFLNQPTVHNGGVSRGVGLWLWLLVLVTGDMWQVTCDTWHIFFLFLHFCPFWYVILSFCPPSVTPKRRGMETSSQRCESLNPKIRTKKNKKKNGFWPNICFWPLANHAPSHGKKRNCQKEYIGITKIYIHIHI